MSVSPLASALSAAWTAVSSLGIEGAGLGGIAICGHGVERECKDVDLLLHYSLGRTEELIACLEESRIEPGPKRTVSIEHPVLRTVHRETGVGIDFLHCLTAYEAGCVNRAVPRETFGVVLPLLTVEDLVIYKVKAGRERDRGDILALLKANPATEPESIFVTMEALEREVPEGLDLTQRFRRILGEREVSAGR